jgi:hypothetical protein
MTTRARTDQTIRWLLDGDAAIRWQTLRDLATASARIVERERQKVAREGWGARLLARQKRDGRWVGGPTSNDGLYTPKWTSTHYTMLLLRDFGLPAANPQARKACTVLLDRGFQPDGGLNYGTWAKWTGQGEMCVTGMGLSILSQFEYNDPRLRTIACYLLGGQMRDGGWNCRRTATHSSLNSTISVLEGLQLYESHVGENVRALRAAQRRGREFLLVHRLFRSHRTGKVIKTEFTRFVFPPRWHYDVLRALDYFRAVDAPRDRRLSEAIDMVRSRRNPDGRWSIEYTYKGKTYFELERRGAPSRWNTLRALRVLRWWEGARSS